MHSRCFWFAGLLGAWTAVSAPPNWAGEREVMELLANRSCPRCDLRGANLVYADLRGANLAGADLSHANLSQAILEGANISGANLTFTSLFGANLIEANLKRAKLNGTDLREANLTGIQADREEIRQAHTEGSRNLATGFREHIDLHNQAVELFERGQYGQAEHLFSQAITVKQDSVESWLGRGMSRAKLENLPAAASDISYASELAQQSGDLKNAERLKKAADLMRQGVIGKAEKKPLFGAASSLGSVLRIIAPIALKAFSKGML